MRALLVLVILALLDARLAHAAAPGFPEAPTRFDAAACHGDTSGKVYIGLFRLVFRFPGVSSIGGIAAYSYHYTKRAPDAPSERVEDYPPRPQPPDPTQPEGCPQHPAQRYHYGIQGAPLVALLGRPDDTQHPDDGVSGDSVSLTAMQPGGDWIGSAGIIPETFSPGPYCGQEDAAEVARHNSKLWCLFRVGDAWLGGGMTKPSVPGVPPVRFSCDGVCTIRVIFTPGLYLLADHRVNAESPRSPIEQMTDFQQRLWTAIQNAEVRNYQWRTAAGTK